MALCYPSQSRFRAVTIIVRQPCKNAVAGAKVNTLVQGNAMNPSNAAANLPAFNNVATAALEAGQTVPDLLLAACQRYGKRPAFSNLGKTLSYAQIDALSSDLAASLQHGLKLTPGERVAIMLPNLLQYPVALLAVLRAGCIAVLVNPLYTPRELQHQLKDSGAAALIVLENFGAVAQQSLQGTAVRHVITTRVGDMLPWPKSALINATLKYLKKAVPPFQLPGALPWPALMQQGRSLPRAHCHVQQQQTVQLQYTGGTTGVAKGAELSHEAVMANVSACEQWLGTLLDPAKDTSLICLPLYHIAAYSNMLFNWAHGIHGELVTNPRDIPGLAKTIARVRPAVFSGVNTLYDALLNNPAFQAQDFSHLKLSIQGGTALRRATADRWQALTGKPVVEMYGLSETCAGITVNRWDAPNPPGSIGQPMNKVEVRLCNEQGQDVPPGEAGELCTRSPQNTHGYWQRPQESQEAFFEGGWFRTGDIARQDENGYLFLLDRKKDMILVSGFNVFPNEVEDVVAQHPGVLEAAAVGIADDKCGEAVKLVVVRKDPELTEASLRAHCRQHLTGYKQPKLIEFRDELPKSAVGKVLRRELRS